MIHQQTFKPGVRCQDVLLQVVDARKIVLTAQNVLEYKGGTVICKGYNIASLHDVFSFYIDNKKISYLASYFTRKNHYSMILSSALRNRTSVFILPLLGLPLTNIGYHDYLYNAYLSTLGETNEILLKYRYFPIPEYREFEKSVFELPQINLIKEGMWEKENNPMTTISVIPEEDISKTVKLFIEGKFSQFPVHHKEAILKFHKASKKSSLYGILYKTDDYRKTLSVQLGGHIKRDAELYDVPAPSEEVLQ